MGRSHKKFDQTGKWVTKEESPVAVPKCVLRIVAFTFCVVLQTTELFNGATPLVSSHDYQLAPQNSLCIAEQITSSFFKLFSNLCS
jgi:hypothetical protein